MGVVKQVKNGKYAADVYDLAGKRHRKWFAERIYAEAYVNRIEVEKSDQKLVEDGLMEKKSTISDAVEDYKKTKTGLTVKSIAKLKRVFDQFKIFCDNHNMELMAKITRDHADAYWNLIKSSDAAPKTKNSYHMGVKALFVFEVERDRLIKSPFSHIKREKEKMRSMIEREDEYYTNTEVKSFFKVPMENKYRQAFTFLLLTGLRVSELQSLKIERSIDLDKKLIMVRKYDDYGTKTDLSERNIPMTDLVYEIIAEIVRENKEGYLFKNQSGGKVSERTLLAKCKLIAKKAGITKNAKVHMWRHTFGTLMKDVGILYEDRQTLMGHKPESMTDRYTKTDPASLQEALTKLDELIK